MASCRNELNRVTRCTRCGNLFLERHKWYLGDVSCFICGNVMYEDVIIPPRQRKEKRISPPVQKPTKKQLEREARINEEMLKLAEMQENGEDYSNLLRSILRAI